MNLQIGLVLVLSVVGINALPTRWQFDDSAEFTYQNELRKQYEQLDERFKESGADNLEDGIEVAKKYLETLKKEDEKSLSGIGDFESTRAVDQFLELEFVLAQDKKCNEDEYEAFQRNVEGVQQFDESTSKIALFVMEATLRLANDCQRAYLENFKKHHLASLNNAEEAKAYRLVDGIMDEVTKAHFGGNSSPSVEEMDEKFEDEDQIEGANDAELVLKALQKLITDPTDRIHLIKAQNSELALNRSELERIYEKYLIAPCNRYVETFGADVFVPAEMVPLNEGHSYNEDSDEMRHFLRGWAHFKYCNALVDDEQGNANEFFDDLYNSIEDMTA